ncbi:MAG: hypothetical protein JWO56_3108 [Acidobacteria bacterium]|nr:hypothetical protein [Acidobacteriota bacterium]
MTAAASLEAARDRARVHAPNRRRLTAAVLSLLLGLALLAIIVQRWRPDRTDPVRALIDAAPRGRRDVVPRLRGFPWAPLHSTRRGGQEADDGRQELVIAASRIAGRTVHDSSPPIRHASALVQFLDGNPRRAAAALQSLAAAHPDAGVSSDLAAAQYVLAIRNDDPSLLPWALVAADAALRLEPSLPEARFNRALIIEALGLRDLARQEWEAYLRLDPGSPWATEAREHVRALPPVEDFLDVLTREYGHLAADPAAARAFARHYRQRSRTWGESEILGSWAKADEEGDAASAAKHLTLARELGAELARDDGNRTLAALVEAIDRADPPRRRLLVQAHRHFGDALRAHRARKPGEAQPLLLQAEAEFARAGSPGELRAAYFIANTMFVQGRMAEAGARLRKLLAGAPPDFPAHRADVLWIIGSIAFSEGHWGACIDTWSEAASLFEMLGEANYAAILRGQIVFVYDRIGKPAAGAWKIRLASFQELGRQLTGRQQEALAAVTRAAMQDEDWPTALSFLGLEIAVARQITGSLLPIESMLYRADVYRRIGQREAALAELTEARRLIAAVPDASFRANLDATAKAVEASLTADPRVAAALLTSAIDYQSTRGRRMHLPDLLRARGHVYRTLGDDALAAADFEAGIVELERHRDTLSGGEDRWGVFHAAEELLGEAIDLALAHNDPRTAFAYAERDRARSLLDSVATPWRPVDASGVPAGTAIIESAIHGESVVLFLLDERGVRAFRRSVVRGRLEADIATLADASASAARLDQAGRSLYKLLIAPLEKELTGKRALALVPDPRLRGIPFAALIDGAGRYLVESYALAVEPSAAFFARERDSRRPAARRHALIVKGAEDLGALSSAEREGEAVASLYPSATRLRRGNATPERFIREAESADVIHFDGHAVAAGGGEAWLALSPAKPAQAGSGDAAGGRLDRRAIASLRLPRTSLVILAACDTAAGEIRSTEGTISLARAFLAAGVPSVIATLRPIEDEAAAEFFPILHQQLARGFLPADALRATQLECIRRGERAGGLWAAVQLIGD